MIWSKNECWKCSFLAPFNLIFKRQFSWSNVSSGPYSKPVSEWWLEHILSWVRADVGSNIFPSLKIWVCCTLCWEQLFCKQNLPSQWRVTNIVVHTRYENAKAFLGPTLKHRPMIVRCKQVQWEKFKVDWPDGEQKINLHITKLL
jgi:hypothetical protein